MYLLYFLLWVIFNGNLTLEVCLFGVVVAAVMFAFSCKFMGYSIAKEKHILKKSLGFLRYAGVLVVEIIKANLAVIHMIFSQQEEPEPALVSFHSPMKTESGRALLADAITLTPGTITVSLENSEYVVHCLDESLAQGIDDSIFVQMLTELEQD